MATRRQIQHQKYVDTGLHECASDCPLPDPPATRPSLRKALNEQWEAEAATEPRTEAGRRMVADLADKEWPVIADILAIEAEAALRTEGLDVERLAKANHIMHGHIDPDRLTPCDRCRLIGRDLSTILARLSRPSDEREEEESR